jgi:hypothetical protein
MGGDMYFASTAVVVCEVLKLIVSLFLLIKDEAGKSFSDVLRKKVLADPWDLLRLSVRSIYRGSLLVLLPSRHVPPFSNC